MLECLNYFRARPVSSEFGAKKKVKARFWPCLDPFSGESFEPLSKCLLLARKRLKTYLKQSVFQIVLQKWISTQICQLILYVSDSAGKADGFVGELSFAQRPHEHFLWNEKKKLPAGWLDQGGLVHQSNTGEYLSKTLGWYIFLTNLYQAVLCKDSYHPGVK